MANLKEIKSRIQSVKSTQKITSAMKMVASAKLRKTEKQLENAKEYEIAMQNLRSVLLHDATGYVSPLSVVRPVKSAIIVVFSSNSGMCGSFNSNIVKELKATIAKYASEGIKTRIITVGKKVMNACLKAEIGVESNYNSLMDKIDMQTIIGLSEKLIRRFLLGEVDQVDLLYYQYHNKATQKIHPLGLLPYNFVIPDDHKHEHHITDYLYEPDRVEMLDAFVRSLLKMELFHAVLNSQVSEHAARTMSMQLATDNADDLLDDLSLQYNKSRQQGITAELLDIMGGTFK